MYTVYKVINKTNNKYYIGVHKTNNPNDSYMGSGNAIKLAILKYGIANFTKEILNITESKEEAYSIEKILTENFISNDNYNMKLGGVGGFTKENSKKGHIARSVKGGKKVVTLGKSFGGENCKNDPVKCGRNGGLANKGKKKSKEHIEAIKNAKLKKKFGSVV